jgi:cell division protein FtsB
MEKFKLFVSRLKPYLNKYAITITLIVVFIVFIDENSVLRRIKLNREINSLKKEIRYYQKLRDTSTQKLENLHSGKDELERIAREEYLMKKPDEEIFLIKE